ncbi:MAG: hypothetical protein ABI442_03370 [Gemmatimonadaceae bacterium]
MSARRGVALFAALMLMVVIGLLAGGAVAASALSQRSLRMARIDATLTAGANYGMSTVLSDADDYGLADLPLGVSRRIAVASDVGDSVIVSATRLAGNLLWLVSVARSAEPDSGVRRFNTIARFPFPGPIPSAGIMARGNVRLGSDVVLSRDTASAADCRPGAAVDFAVAPGSVVTRVVASPDTLRVLTTPAAADSASYYLLRRQIALLDSGGRIVHARADTTVVGGTFMGILVVDGSLTIAGPFHATGFIVVRGGVSAVAGGFELNGALVSFAPNAASPAIDLAAATVVFSPCAVSRAFRLAAPPRPVPKRSWAEMF